MPDQACVRLALKLWYGRGAVRFIAVIPSASTLFSKRLDGNRQLADDVAVDPLVDAKGRSLIQLSGTTQQRTGSASTRMLHLSPHRLNGRGSRETGIDGFKQAVEAAAHDGQPLGFKTRRHIPQRTVSR